MKKELRSKQSKTRMKVLFGSIFLLVIGIIYLIFGIVYLKKEETVVVIIYFILTAFTISLSVFGVISSAHSEYIKKQSRDQALILQEEPQGLLDAEDLDNPQRMIDKTPEEIYFNYLEENASNL